MSEALNNFVSTDFRLHMCSAAHVLNIIDEQQILVGYVDVI